MRRVFKKFFSNSSSDGVNEKSSRKFLTTRNRVSAPNLINQVKLSKSNNVPIDDLSLSSSTTSKFIEERLISSSLDHCKNEPLAANLHAAVIEGNVELVEKLLTQGADAETIDENGLTPFLKVNIF